MSNFKVFHFGGFRLGDKIVACYQLQYYALVKGYEYILIDTTSEDLFSIKEFFPSIGKYVVDTNNHLELYNDLISKGYETMHLGNLWISSPSLKKDTQFKPNMMLPIHLKMFQDNYFDETGKRILDYKIKIVNHCLTDAGYNQGRNMNKEQFDRLMSRVKNYITTNNIDAVLLDIPIDYSWTVTQVLTMIELGDLYIGGDTGFTHAFASFNPNKPLVAIYGPNEHDILAFESEKIQMNASSSWSSNPLSDNYFKYYMVNNLFNEEAVYLEIIKQINKLDI